MLTTRAALLATVSEARWQRQVIDMAKRAHWLCFHVHDSRTQEWGTDPGFPDLILCKDERLLFIELKTEHGRVSAAQSIWLQALDLPGVEVYIWRPSHADIARQVLGA